MQITFDPRDPDACASVLAMIAAVQPGAAPAALAAFDELPDPAQAFDAPDPAQAFGGNAPVASHAVPLAAATAPTPEAADSPVAPVTTPPSPAPTASPPVSFEVDADGVPWDSRIHSGPADKRPKNADGRWRRGRGVDDETHARVTAELRQAAGLAPVAPAPAAPVPPSPEPAAAAPPVPAAPVAAAPAPAPTAPPPIPAAAATESGPAVATVAASPAPTNFAEVMRYVTGRQTAGTLTVAQTSEVCAALNLAGLRDLMQQPDMIPAFMASLPEAAA